MIPFKLLLPAALAFLWLIANSASAEELRIAVIDPNRVVEESPQYNAAREALRSEVTDREASLIAQQEKIDELNGRLDKDGPLMSEDEIARLQDDIRARTRRLRYAKAEWQEDFARRQTELRAKLVKQVEEVVKRVAEEQAVDIILSEGVIYSSERVDISSEVIERLKQEFADR